MSIVKEEELLKYPITFIKVDDMKAPAYVKFNDLIRFLEFGRDTNIFYLYDYYEQSLYHAEKDFLDDFVCDQQELDFWKNWAEIYNQSASEVDFTIPRRLTMFCYVDGIYAGYRVEDNWLTLDDAKHAAEKYRDEHEEEIVALYSEEDEEECMSLYETFQETLLKDDRFRHCTNKGNRSYYIRQFLAKKENKKFYNLVGRRNLSNLQKDYELNMMADAIYDTYRNECWALKIKVGDPLPEKKKQNVPIVNED